MMLWTGIVNIFAPSGAERAVVIQEPIVKVFVGEVFGVPAQFLWFILFALILGLLLHFHKFGSWIYATGDNKEAARAMGINTDLVKIICFMIVGFLCAFSSIIQVIRVGAFNVVLGTFYELQAIAACVMGGVSLFGGRGGVIGILLGSFLIPIIQNGMVFVGINPAGTTAFIGMAIIIFALLNILMERGWR
jgi:simple sugar transport system permease protein